MMKRIERTFLVAGFVLLGFLLYRLGPGVVFDNVRRAGWGISLIVLQEILAYGANTLGWWYAFTPPRPAITFSHLLAARIAGDSINYVTPTATIGGEFVRVRLLRERVATTSVVASVAIAKLTQTVGQVAFIVVGLIVVVQETPLPAALRSGVMIGVATMVAIVAGLLIAQRRGLFAPVLRALHALGLPEYTPGLGGRLERLDDEIARFYTNAKGQFVLSAGCFFVGWTLGVLEAYLILLLLRVPASFKLALAIETFSAAIDAVLFFVPGKVGTQEGGKVLIFTLLGLDAAKGLSFGLLRRIRELTWSAIGLLILARLQAEPRSVAKPATTGS